MEKIVLIIEKGNDKELWGRVTFDDNLITDSAPSIGLLEKKMKKALEAFHGLDSAKIEFDLAHDLTAVFDQKDYLNLSAVAERIGINRSLMAQYAAGKKFPSPERARKIEKTIHELGRDLLKLRIAVKGESLRRETIKRPAKAAKRVRQKV